MVKRRSVANPHARDVAIATSCRRRQGGNSTAARRLCLVAFVSAFLPGTAAAEPDLSVLLDILASASEGEWVNVNENLFSDVWTPEYLRPLVGSPHKIIEAWSSFAWDSNRGDLIIYGGGHANYAGNDVYRWRGTTLKWERASLPSEVTVDFAGQDVTVDGPDFAPVSAHTYDNNVFVPHIDRFLTFGGAKYAQSGPFTRDRGDGLSRRTGPYAFNPNKADPNKVGGSTGSHVQREGAFPEIIGGEMWQNRDIYDYLSVGNGEPSGFISGTTAVTEENGYDVVYVTGTRNSTTQQQLYKYTLRSAEDPSDDSWQRVGSYWESFSGQGAGAYDSNLNLYVRTAGQRFVYWDLNNPGEGNRNKRFVPTATNGSFALTTAYGMDYDPVRDQYLLWRGGGSVWALRSPGKVSTAGWTITLQPPSLSEVPLGKSVRGVLGKWKYIAQLDAFVGLVDATEGNVWVYKPIGWLDPRSNNEPPGPGGAGAENVPPTVNFGFACAGLSCAFLDASNDLDGSIESWFWEFGDGANSVARNPDHTYPSAGTYTVRLTATDNEGSMDEAIQSLTVTVQLPDDTNPGDGGEGGSDEPQNGGGGGGIFQEPIIAAGEITIDHQWQRVEFGRTFVDPVVIVKPLSGNGGDPATVRLDDVDGTGFSVRLQEWEYLDGWHVTEEVGFIVMERGRHQLPDGRWVEAGSWETGGSMAFANVSFQEPFATVPVVLSAVTSYNGTDAVTTRMQEIDGDGFQVKLQEQEAKEQKHVSETVGYIAWEASSGVAGGYRFEVGRTPKTVDSSDYRLNYLAPFDVPPVFLADMQSTNGGDTANLRWKNKGPGSVEIWIDEEASRDRETNHISEDIGYLLIQSP